MQNLKLIIKVKAKTPDMNIDKNHKAQNGCRVTEFQPQLYQIQQKTSTTLK